MSLILLLLAGCNDESLYSGLDEVEANEMIALLSNAGIVSYKAKNSDERYTVSTHRNNFADAIDLLKTSGYPKNRFESLGDVFKKEGFVSSPLEERARLNYAQSQELSRTIESIDGVILARVHLAIPKENKLEYDVKPSSASVFIKHRRGIDLSDRESQIKALLVNSITGLPYENVTVAMFSSNPIPVNRKNSNLEMSKLSLFTEIEKDNLILGMSLLVIILIPLTGYLILRNRKQSSQLQISSNNS
ncbi:type III secretion system inner membrane ring lipoprotein SctJ [Candidatus Thiodiazotropha endoloripes]|uniref:type III secretion system inner membrane ring lipoprotein SctJ n=1 Tax=Candidatus Thiodiazotropha endoloripes TaxID=1818881 RepID=UPI0013914B1C|nr:type III secretion inner membrane ring lipoprotein SctJ [Candidatus Thiodiazotropha endoloripes]